MAEVGGCCLDTGGLECQSKKFELNLVGNRVVQRHFDQKSDIANVFFFFEKEIPAGW